MTEQEVERRQRWGQLIARAWSDERFKHRLLTEPATVLKEAGLETRREFMSKSWRTPSAWATWFCPPSLHPVICPKRNL